jgi:hypothetical protein
MSDEPIDTFCIVCWDGEDGKAAFHPEDEPCPVLAELTEEK